MTSLSNLLKKELENRQSKNRAYSLRAFANFLGVSPATLSQLLSEKRAISSKMGKSMLEKLGLSPRQQIKYLTTLSKEAKSLSNDLEKDKQHSMIQDDIFHLISDWYHFGILSLGELKHCQADPRWVARQLKIPVNVANEALGRLERLKIIEVKNGTFKQIAPPLSTSNDIPSAAIRNYHRQILALAQSRLEQVAVEEREYSTVTMAVNTKKIHEAKKLIREFKKDMAELLETGSKSQVYQLSIQLFPLNDKEIL
ncbi:MAG: TIGR02147 family protein [Bacteriovoracaceae bacterium]